MRHRPKIMCFVSSSDADASEDDSGPTVGRDATPAQPQANDVSISRLQRLLAARENEHLEFKEARNNFHFEKLVKYCAALANEGGGSIVLGVGDRRPRRVVGSQAFTDIERTKAGLLERLRLRIDIQEIIVAEGRVLVVTAPSRPLGIPVAVDGACWMRAGEDLVPMTPDVLRRIFNEARPDFSAEVCRGAVLDDLEAEAVRQFRIRWHSKTNNAYLLHLSTEQLLRDAELVMPDGVTYAALILLGTGAALTTHLAQSETIFEYRSSEAPGPANQREEFRRGFLTFYDRLWELVNLRNDLQHYQERFVMHSIPTFRETSVREAILNAAAHRDYREAGSIFIRQYARRIEIVSPGGFAGGVSADNILDKQFPRNRRIAESFLRCGLVERSGQGVNRMLIEAVSDSKPVPDYSQSDEYEVFLTIKGEVEDDAVVKLLTRLTSKQKAMLLSRHYLVLDLIRRHERIPYSYRKELEFLKSFDVIRSEGSGRAVRYLLESAIDSPWARNKDYGGVYARDEAKRSLLAYIKASPRQGRSVADIQNLIPNLSRGQIRALLRDLRAEGLIHVAGERKGSRWLPAGESGPP